jgi:hypothetical protein
MATVPSNVEAFEHEWGYHTLPDGRLGAVAPFPNWKEP